MLILLLAINREGIFQDLSYGIVFSESSKRGNRIFLEDCGMNKYLAMIVISILLSPGCTWVHISPAGEEVRVASAAEVGECEKIGVTTVSLMAKIAGIKRSAKKVATELQTLGRNSGAEMGGDTIVPVSDIVNGEQSFQVYRCLGR
jgi:hypothetical protein